MWFDMQEILDGQRRQYRGRKLGGDTDNDNTENVITTPTHNILEGRGKQLQVLAIQKT